MTMLLRAVAIMCSTLVLSGCAVSGLQSLTDSQRLKAHRVESALNAPGGFEGQFVQTGSRTGNGAGQFWYRPGMLHLVYISPHAMDLMAQNGHLVLDDRLTGVRTRLNLARNPLGLLLHHPVRFVGDILVTDVQSGGSSIQLSLAEANNPSQGLLTLQFIDRDGSFQLAGLDGVDARQNRIALHFYNVVPSRSAAGDSPKN